jgi:hypothetical protein
MPENDSDTRLELAVIARDIQYMKGDIHDIKNNVQQGYVSKDEFEPVRRIVYGLVGLILVAVVGALISLVVVK